MRKIAVVVACLIAVAYQLPPASGQPTVIENSALGEFGFDPFDPPLARSIFLRDVEARIRDRFGEPDNEKVWACSHQNVYLKIECVTLDYSGLVFEFQRWQERPEWAWLFGIEITSAAHNLKHDLRIGSNRADIVAALATEEIPSRLQSYRFSSHYTDPNVLDPEVNPGRYSGTVNSDLSVDFDEDGRIERFEWYYSSSH